MDNLELFKLTFEQVNKANKIFDETSLKIQADYEAEVRVAFKEHEPRKRKFSWNKTYNENFQLARKEIFAKYKPLANKCYDNKKLALEETEKTLNALADVLEPEKSDEFVLAFTTSVYEYHTQGFGAFKYAQSSAEEKEAFYKRQGIEAKTEIVKSESNDTIFKVYVKLTDIGLEILKRKKIKQSLLDWAIDCWKRGTNPKVFNPFLPDEIFDKSMNVYMEGQKTNVV